MSSVYPGWWLHCRLVALMVPCAIIAPLAGAPNGDLMLSDTIWTAYNCLVSALLVAVSVALYVRRGKLPPSDAGETKLLFAYSTTLIVYYVLDVIYWRLLLSKDPKYLSGMVIIAIVFAVISFGLTVVRTGVAIFTGTDEQLEGLEGNQFVTPLVGVSRPRSRRSSPLDVPDASDAPAGGVDTAKLLTGPGE